MTYAIGIDVGSGVIKTALFKVEGEQSEWLSRRDVRIRQRDPFKLVDESIDYVIEKAGLTKDDIDYIATTGEGENIKQATGHFYSMTTHARGAIYLNPEARAVLDIGALNGRAINIDEHGKVLNYRMTSQCASGSGQFLENIARYLGIAQDEIGELSQQSTEPEKVSGICAVLAETDVINMVSRSIPPSDILRGIHESMAGRLVKLLKAIGAKEGVVMMTGGLALDSGLVKAMEDGFVGQKMNTQIAWHKDSMYAGAIGAALWGAFRHEKLKTLNNMAKAS